MTAERRWLRRMTKILYFGVRDTAVGGEPFGIDYADRFRHTYAIGASGSGKSTLLHNILAQEMLAGEGCGLIDPHGDLANAALGMVPKCRTSDTLLIDLADSENPPAFNPLYRVPEELRPLVAANLTSAFKHVWSDSWGPRLEYILTNALLTLLDAPDRARPTLLALPMLLTKPAYRHWCVQHTRDPRVRAFWRDEFERYSERFATEAIAPVMNKVGAFLTSRSVRNIVGQWRSTIDFHTLLDRKPILIVNLARGQIGSEPASLMGALLVAMIQTAAMTRIGRPIAERTAFHLVIDEFAYVTSSAFADILAESRKANLAVTLAHQHLAQMRQDVRAAVLANAATIVAFRTGAEDTQSIASVLGDVKPSALTELRRGEAWIRSARATTMPVAHQVKTFAPIASYPERADVVRRHVRGRLCTSRAIVEPTLNNWLEHLD